MPQSFDVLIAVILLLNKYALCNLQVDDVKEEAPVVDAIPELLKRIAQNQWFPKGVILDVEHVTWALSEC